MSRHLYDLEKLMDTKFAADALGDEILYNKIISHRAKFYHVGKVNYALNNKNSIDFIPSGDLEKAYREDYKSMLSSFIYGQPTLNYDELIERIKTLVERFRSYA